MSTLMLTPNFSRAEFVVSQTAIRKSIDNTPPGEAWDNLQALALTCLEPARVILGPLRISSGYRCPELNAAIGGARGSQHMLGEAADVIPASPATSLGELYRWLAKCAPFDQLIWEFGEWVHVSHKRAGPQRRETLIAYRFDGKTKYAPMTEEQITTL